MKYLLPGLLFCLALTGCCRKKDEVWDDTKTCGRYMARGISSLGGKHCDSRQVCSREEFIRTREDCGFVPLPDECFDDQIAMADYSARDPGPSVPGIESFVDPTNDPRYKGAFSHVHFDLNSNLVKGREDLATVRKVSEYMKKNPSTYVYIEGHCDERGAEAYNLALGSRRANAVRASLIKEGVDPNKVFTVSYGKERPYAQTHTEQAWALNRRAQFKLYQR